VCASSYVLAAGRSGRPLWRDSTRFDHACQYPIFSMAEHGSQPIPVRSAAGPQFGGWRTYEPLGDLTDGLASRSGRQTP
jgi:hypothetical protein